MPNVSFDDFKSVSKSDQYQKIQADLRKQSDDSSLEWVTPEGISLQPIYHKEDIEVEEGFTAKARPWKLGQYIQFTHVEECLKRTEDALANGVEALYFVLKDESDWISEVLHRITGKEVQAFFFFKQPPSQKAIQDLKNCDHTFLLYDPLGRSEEWGTELFLAAVDNYIANTATLFVDCAIYANAGAHAVQQIAFGLAHINEYLAQFSPSIEEDIEIVVRIAQGGSYFTEISKLVAFRSLAETMLKEYPLKTSLKIIVEPLQRNKGRVDYNVNLLRTSSEMMSAVLGEADVVVNHPYDLRFNPPNRFSDRMARNQLLILKHESYFDQLPRVTQGAYYIESLIRELKTSAWAQFLSIETAGGWLAEIQNNSIQSQIEQTRENEKALIEQGKAVVVGVTKYFDKKALSASAKKKDEHSKDTFIHPLKLLYTTS